VPTEPSVTVQGVYCSNRLFGMRIRLTVFLQGVQYPCRLFSVATDFSTCLQHKSSYRVFVIPPECSVHVRGVQSSYRVFSIPTGW
jgi:hypothetical protein